LKIAIVGADGTKWTKEQKEKAKHFIRKLLHMRLLAGHLPVVVSGHCPKGGVDIWAEEIADELGIKKEIYPAEVHQWDDKIVKPSFVPSHFPEYVRRSVRERMKGYRSRNIEIAKACDVLYDIEPKGSCRHCGGIGRMQTPTSVYSTFFDSCHWCKGTGIYSGGTWTMRYAEKLGKEVHQVVIE